MRYYVRKTNRGSTPQELMQTAAYAVMQGQSLRRISRELGICHATLFRFIKKLKSGETPTVGYKPKLLFTAEQEQQLLKNLVEYAKVMSGLTLDNIKKLSFQLAKQWNYEIPDSWSKNKTASKDWADKFVKRHNFPVKLLKGNSNLNNFYNMLHKLIEEHKFLPSQIFYLEEITISLGKNLSKPVYLELATNALGETLKPIFRMNLDECKIKDKSHLCNGSRTGAMNPTDFLTYLNHVIDHTKPCKEKPILLLLDSHKYIDINVLKKVNESPVILLSFPECVGSKPFTRLSKYVKKANKYQKLLLKPENYDVLDLVSAVMPTKLELVKCFQKNGVWPFNPRVVTGEEFVPAAVEEYNFQQSEQPQQPVAGPSKVPTMTPSVPDTNVPRQRDPLGTLDQCRFCGEFRKECVFMSDMPYLLTNVTTLACNDTIVQIDFNDKTLPKTACKECDAKLKDMFKFVKTVKNAQLSLIAVEEPEDIIEQEPTFETLVIKTECDESDEDQDDSEDQDVKDEIVDSLTLGTTEFIKKPVTNKRKTDEVADKAKKAKAVKKREDESKDSELIIDIKEEVVDEMNEDGNMNQYCVSDTGTDVKPSEGELAANSIVYEMRSDSGGFS